MSEALAGLIRECRKQPVETVLLQGLRQAHATNFLKAHFEALLADPQLRRQVTEINQILSMEGKVLANTCDDLHWILADNIKQ
jgi:hypothetical protein